MAQVARANVNAARRRPAQRCRRLSVQFRGMGFPEQEIVVTGTVKEERDGVVVVDTEAEQGGNADHPQRRGRARHQPARPVAGPWRPPQ